MSRKSANTLALTLLATAAAVAAPVVTDLVQRAANRPGTERGSRRRLQSIRDGGVPPEMAEEFFMLEDEGPYRG